MARSTRLTHEDPNLIGFAALGLVDRQGKGRLGIGQLGGVNEQVGWAARDAAGDPKQQAFAALAFNDKTHIPVGQPQIVEVALAQDRGANRPMLGSGLGRRPQQLLVDGLQTPAPAA